jgi:hypothetical protein
MMRWAVKRQFLRYIARMPDGRCSVTDGATVAGDEFLFESDASSATEPGVLKYRGDVRFSGHHGLLFLRIADPWLETRDGAVTLTIAADPDRVTLATLEIRPDTHGRAGVDLRLTEAGSELFNQVYPAGSPLDDLAVLDPH